MNNAMSKEKKDMKINGGCKQWKRKNKILIQKLKQHLQMLMPYNCNFKVKMIVNARTNQN